MASGNCFNKCPRIYLWSLGLAAGIGGSFLAIAEALSLWQGSALFENENLFLSLTCAIIAWLLLAIFLFGKETIYLPVHQTANFLGNARQVLEEMGYEVTSQSGSALATRHMFHFLFVGRGIRIQCQDKQARLTGSKIWVEMLRRRLRVQNYLSSSEIALHDSVVRGPCVLLKRVQIQMRVPPEKLAEVNRHVLQVLSREAEVVCEVSILAQSDNGLRESTLENQVRTWLNEQGIAAEIRKDLAKMSESTANFYLPEINVANLALRPAYERSGAKS